MGGAGMIITGRGVEIVMDSRLIFLILASVLGTFIQLSMIMSLRYEKASIISLIESLTVVYGFIADIVIFDEPISVASVIGGILIVGSFVYMTVIDMEKAPEIKEEKPKKQIKPWMCESIVRLLINDNLWVKMKLEMFWNSEENFVWTKITLQN